MNVLLGQLCFMQQAEHASLFLSFRVFERHFLVAKRGEDPPVQAPAQMQCV